MPSTENVIIIVLDTTRASEAFDPTVMPTLAALGSRGMRYTAAYSSAPWTLPAHGSLFTGMYPSRHGAHGGHLSLEPSNETIATVLRDHGYETCAVSNNTWVSPEFGFDRGFQTFQRGWQLVQSDTDLGVVAHASGRRAKLSTAVSQLFDGFLPVNVLNLLHRLVTPVHTDKGARRATRFVDSWLEAAVPPFFLFINFLEPHLPYRPPDDLARRYLPDDWTLKEARSIRQDPRAYDGGEYTLDDRQLTALRGLYRGALAYVDAQLGRLVDTLEAAGILDETLLIVVGDHGENIGDHGFLGHQFSLYDTVIHVPLVVHGGPFDGGTVSEDLVQVLDLVPTILDVLGLEAPQFRQQLDGRSLHPDATDSREHVLAEYIQSQPAVETLEDRYGSVPDRVRAGEGPLRAIRTDRWKVIVGEHVELYDVAADPAEQHEISDSRPAVCDQLTDRLDEWQRTVRTPGRGGSTAISAETEARLEQLGYR